MSKRRLLLNTNQVEGLSTFPRVLWANRPLEAFIGGNGVEVGGNGGSFFTVLKGTSTYLKPYYNQLRVNDYSGITLSGNVNFSDGFNSGVLADNVTIDTSQINSLLLRNIGARNSMTVDGILIPQDNNFAYFKTLISIEHLVDINASFSSLVPSFTGSNGIYLEFPLKNSAGTVVETPRIILNNVIREIQTKYSNTILNSSSVRITVRNIGESFESSFDDVWLFVELEFRETRVYNSSLSRSIGTFGTIVPILKSNLTLSPILEMDLAVSNEIGAFFVLQGAYYSKGMIEGYNVSTGFYD